MSKTIKIDFTELVKNHQGDTMKDMSSDGKTIDLELGNAITNLILQLASLDNKDAIRAWNLSVDILKTPKDYEMDSDKLDFIITCFEKTQPQALIKGQILQKLKNFKEELDKQP